MELGLDFCSLLPFGSDFTALQDDTGQIEVRGIQGKLTRVPGLVKARGMEKKAQGYYKEG